MMIDYDRENNHVTVHMEQIAMPISPFAIKTKNYLMFERQMREREKESRSKTTSTLNHQISTT